MAKFKTRNLYHLRISSHSVLPLYLYVDERHLNWMTDFTLQMVLADLRPLILPKLQKEQNTYIGPAFNAPPSAKKGTVDVHRGDTYQFAYFFRKAEPHSVLLKSRRFVVEAKQEVDPPIDSNGDQPAPSTGKRKRGQSTAAKKQAKKNELTEAASISAQATASTGRILRTKPTKVTALPRSENVDDDPIEVDSDDLYAPAMDDADADYEESPRAIKLEDGLAGLPGSQPSKAPLFVESLEDEDEKPKLSVRLKYQGFSITGRCLCVVVEPWPPIKQPIQKPEPEGRMTPKERFLSSSRAATPLETLSEISRESTPLFLAEDFRCSVTPAPFASQQQTKRVLPPVPLFHDVATFEDEDDGEFDMLQLSQILRDTGGDRGGSGDDDSDGDVLLGDADEARVIF